MSNASQLMDFLVGFSFGDDAEGLVQTPGQGHDSTPELYQHLLSVPGMVSVATKPAIDNSSISL